MKAARRLNAEQMMLLRLRQIVVNLYLIIFCLGAIAGAVVWK